MEVPLAKPASPNWKANGNVVVAEPSSIVLNVNAEPVDAIDVNVVVSVCSVYSYRDCAFVTHGTISAARSINNDKCFFIVMSFC